ncbi:MAG: transcription-repair coupling factor [Bacilli bacterium]|nr:transcription-repair coupling factor [Bacilli bacterium]
MNFFDSLFSIDDSKVILGLNDELKAIYIYNYFVQNNTSIVVITNTLYEANNFYKSLRNYTDEVLFFPMDDFLTSEALAISPELEITRLETINSSFDNVKKIIVTNLMGYLRFLPLKDNYQKNIISLNKNQEYDIKKLESDLYNIGYNTESFVNKTGEFAPRGFVLDVFPIGFENPIRIEFWGDTIDSIKSFNIDTQLTKESIDNIQILPNTEFISNTEVVEEERKQKNLIKYSKVTNISNYFNNPKFVYIDYNNIKLGYKNLLEDILNFNQEKNLPNDTKYMFELENLDNETSLYLSSFDDMPADNLKVKKYISGNIESFEISIDKINNKLSRFIKNNKTIIICLKDKYTVNKVMDELKNNNFIFTNLENIYQNKINLVVKNINHGFEFNNYIVISESEFFNKKSNNVLYKSNFKYGIRIKDITKLNVGDYVVHISYGIGQYKGLKTLSKNGLMKDYLMVEYANSDKLYIPVEKIELITKYSANDGLVPKINKLGGTEWAKTKARLKKKIEDITQDLLKLYAERKRTKGFAFLKDTEEQAIFEAAFPFEETKDQLRAITEIKKDMESENPMDRLLCGDVGFGKTEVAFRAIYKAILSGKQVAFLCPTTILSNQHFNNAIDRFKDTGVNIEVLNRFVSSTKTKDILERLKKGNVDLLIGTHRILSKDIIFKDLGLLVVDEEQRFGVKHKEKIKEYKNNIDVLTLSATPIPRTLQMSVAGLRGLSLIETPPVNRYPVQTYVLSESKQIIKEAVYRELARNGQTFILYNRVEEMESKKRELESIIPDAKIGIIHGQMTKIQIENIMANFLSLEFDVLLCTTIIETGIDIPTVNTLIIMDADHFGLSQLYQIRGRVGRSDKIAYCYLMYNQNKILSEIAVKRLDVIKQFTELGSGFNIAMRDLSIRGAGDILGSEQAGFIDSVGIELFLNMLNEEVNKLNGNVQEESDIKDVPLLDVETAIDDKYISDNEIKISIHKRINQIDSIESLEKIKYELEDRFGKLSENMIIYMYEELFEKMARKVDIYKVEQNKNFIKLIFDEEFTNKIKVEDIFIEISKISRMFRFSTLGKKLVIILDTVYLEKHFVYYLVDLMNLILEKYCN